MKPQASPLRIIDFAVTGFEFDLVSLGPDSNIFDAFNNYDLNIDFDINNVDKVIKVFIKAEVNRLKTKLPGYSLKAEAACFFMFDKELDEKVKRELEGYSTIYIALNSLRGLISNFTANAPFGRYILPSVDLNDLIEKKKASLVIDRTSEKNKVEKTSRNNKTKKT